MNFLLDTQICIHLLSQRPPEIIRRFRQHQPGDIAISLITVSELYARLRSRAGAEDLEAFLAPFELLPYDTEAVQSYGRIQAALAALKLSLNPLDVLVAAQALSRGLILVSNTEQPFRQISGLGFENWQQPTP